MCIIPNNTIDGLRILVVEDDALIAHDIVASLAEARATVLGPCPTIQAAQEILDKTDAIDLAVLDIKIGDTTVYGVAQQLRDRGVPFVFATGYAHDVIPLSFATVARWEKPFSVDDLIQALPAIRLVPERSRHMPLGL